MKSVHKEQSIWLVMIALTLSTYIMSKLGFEGLGIVLILLLTAAVKGGFIIRDFMELRGVSLVWQSIMYGWLGIVCLAIAIIYIVGL